MKNIPAKILVAITYIRNMFSEGFLHLTEEYRRSAHSRLKWIDDEDDAWANLSYALADLFESIALAINKDADEESFS